eukprot:365734-Chlamydomonas_euryale.AAC.5
MHTLPVHACAPCDSDPGSGAGEHSIAEGGTCFVIALLQPGAPLPAAVARAHRIEPAACNSLSMHALPMTQYIEIDIDVSANNVAAYVTGLVRGATKSLVIDMGFVLEGTTPWELPECLLGAIRLNYLDITKAKPLDLSREIPLARAAMPSPPPAAQADEAQGVPSTKHRKTPSFASHQFNPELLGPQLSRPSVASRSSNG